MSNFESPELASINKDEFSSYENITISGNFEDSNNVTFDDFNVIFKNLLTKE